MTTAAYEPVERARRCVFSVSQRFLRILALAFLEDAPLRREGTLKGWPCLAARDVGEKIGELVKDRTFKATQHLDH
jgi:hypothetical protein